MYGKPPKTASGLDQPRQKCRWYGSWVQEIGIKEKEAADEKSLDHTALADGGDGYLRP